MATYSIHGQDDGGRLSSAGMIYQTIVAAFREVSLQAVADNVLVGLNVLHFDQGSAGLTAPKHEEAATPKLPNNNELQRLIEEFCPRFVLHKKEQYFPSSVEWYMEHCELWHNDTLVLPRGKVCNSTLTKQHCNGSSSCGAVGPDGHLIKNADWRLKCDPKYHYGMGKDAINDVPVYVRARPSVVNGTGVIALSYITFYPYNGAYDVAGLKVGGHEADWEHATVHLVPKGNQQYDLHSVWFHAHRERDGTLKEARDVKRDADGHPVVAVARNGHGTYWSFGTFLRLYGFANDSTSEGTRWAPNHVKLLPDPRQASGEFEWVKYPGRWGTPFDMGHGSEDEMNNKWRVKGPGGSPSGPATQDWWGYEPCRSRHWFKRTFTPWAA